MKGKTILVFLMIVILLSMIVANTTLLAHAKKKNRMLSPEELSKKTATEKEDSTVDFKNGDKGCNEDHTHCKSYAKKDDNSNNNNNDRSRASKAKIGPFVVYENPIYGVSIQYPDNWHKSENNLPSHGVVKFSAPDVKEKESKHSISIFIPAFLIVAVEDLPSKDVKLDQYVTDYLSKGFPNPTDYKILNSTQSTIAGNPAKRVILYDYSGGHTYEEMRVITIINGTSYRVGLFGEPGMFSDYIPIAQKMIDSFQITK